MIKESKEKWKEIFDEENKLKLNEFIKNILLKENLKSLDVFTSSNPNEIGKVREWNKKKVKYLGK